MKWRSWLSCDSDDTDSDANLIEKIEWVEEVNRDYTLRTERLVWSGGAEKEVEYCLEVNQYAGPRYEYYDLDHNLVLEVNDLPAYTETIDEVTVTRTEEIRQTAWVPKGAPIPEYAERVGEERRAGHE